MGEASHAGPTGGEFGRFPNTPHSWILFQRSMGAAVQFDLRSDTESVLSGPDVPRDAFGEDVEPVGDEVWSVAGTEEVVSGRDFWDKRRACVMKVVPQFLQETQCELLWKRLLRRVMYVKGVGGSCS